MNLQESYVDRWFNKLAESLLTEGTHYDKNASKIISESGLFDEEISDKIIDGLFREDIHAFVHAPAWLEKYLLGIARMLVEEANGDQQRAEQFLNDCPAEFDKYLEYIKVIRQKLASDKDKVELDNNFKNVLHYKDIVNKNKETQKELDAESDKQLANMESVDNGYELIPIDSYKQMHSMFGGRATGDGLSDGYAGGGGTAWCHTNAKNVYDNWVKNGKNKFFVLAKNNWKEIPFNKETNEQYHGKDEYGNSLIAILVDTETGDLLKATLRCNHVGNLIGGADNQYQTYAELSDIAGFNVKDKVYKILDLKLLQTLVIKDLAIKDITLLSIEEAEQIPEKYRKFSWYWWLRSPGYYRFLAADVDYDGSVYSHGSDVSIDRGCVRPALVISNRKSLNLPLCSRVELDNGTEWIVINDHMLLCNDKSFGNHRFDENSNDYEKSEIKQYIHEKAKDLGLL